MRLKDICTVFIDGDWIESKDQSDEGIRLIQTGNIGEGAYLEKETRAKYISEDTFEKLKCTEVYPGDILVSRLPEPVGRACIIPEKKERMITAVDCTICRPDKSIVSKEYLCYFMRSNAYYARLLGNVTGTTRKRISRKNLGSVELNIPSREEQKEVVKQLDCLVSVIASRTKELQLLDDLIKARFVEMFGDAVDNPMGWEKRQLQEIVTDDCTISYGIVRTGDDQEEGVPVFRPVDIVNRVPKLDELKKTTEEISNKYKRTVLKGREMLITVRANIADTYIIGEEFKGCNVGRGIVPIRTKEDIMVLEFLKYLMDSKHLNDKIRSKAKGITLIQLNMEDLREVELIVPPLEQQKVFVEFANQVNKSKFAVQKTLEQTQTLFDSLMQKYFG